MISVEQNSDETACQIIVAPNQSMSWHHIMIFFASIASVSLSVSIVLTLQGFWPILPFAGLELIGLGIALYITSSRLSWREVISIDEQHVTIECGRRRPERQSQFIRSWVKIKLVKPRRSWYPTRLLIGSHGKHIEIGSFLCDDEREELAGELNRKLRF